MSNQSPAANAEELRRRHLSLRYPPSLTQQPAPIAYLATRNTSFNQPTPAPPFSSQQASFVSTEADPSNTLWLGPQLQPPCATGASGSRKKTGKRQKADGETRGKKPYELTTTALRKIVRVCQFLDPHFEDLSRSFREAGGACKSVLTKAVQKVTGRTPGDKSGRLASEKGKAARTAWLESNSSENNGVSSVVGHGDAVFYQHPATTSHAVEPQLPHGADGYHTLSDESQRLAPIAESSSHEQSVAQPVHQHGEDNQLAVLKKSGREREKDNSLSAGGGKKPRRSTQAPWPSHTSSKQIDWDRFAVDLAARMNISPERVDRVVNRMSAARTSDSTKSIGDFLTGQSRICARLSLAGQGNDAAAAYDIYEMVKAGDSVHETTANGQTPLHLAVNRGNPAVCGILLWAGADPDAKTHAQHGVWENASSAHDQCARREDGGELYTRIIQCVDLVRHGLAGVEPCDRPYSPVLLGLCNQLDPDETRREEREVEFHMRTMPNTQSSSGQTQIGWGFATTAASDAPHQVTADRCAIAIAPAAAHLHQSHADQAKSVVKSTELLADDTWLPPSYPQVHEALTTVTPEMFATQERASNAAYTIAQPGPVADLTQPPVQLPSPAISPAIFADFAKADASAEQAVDEPDYKAQDCIDQISQHAPRPLEHSHFLNFTSEYGWAADDPLQPPATQRHPQASVVESAIGPHEEIEVEFDPNWPVRRQAAWWEQKARKYEAWASFASIQGAQLRSTLSS